MTSCFPLFLRHRHNPVCRHRFGCLRNIKEEIFGKAHGTSRSASNMAAACVWERFINVGAGLLVSSRTGQNEIASARYFTSIHAYQRIGIEINIKQNFSCFTIHQLKLQRCRIQQPALFATTETHVQGLHDDKCLQEDHSTRRHRRTLSRNNAKLHQSIASCVHQLRGVRVQQQKVGCCDDLRTVSLIQSLSLRVS